MLLTWEKPWENHGKTMGKAIWLVVSNMNGLLSMSYMGCHPKPIDELIFSRWLKTTNQNVIDIIHDIFVLIVDVIIYDHLYD